MHAKAARIRITNIFSCTQCIGPSAFNGGISNGVKTTDNAKESAPL